MAKSKLLGFILVLILLGTLAYFYPAIQEKFGITGNTVNNQPEKEQAVLVRVIDGDTIVVTGPVIGNETHIRLLGINTPEKKMPFASQAANYTSSFINQTIILEKDITDTDMYGRKLRYLFYDNRLIDQEILELGLANSYMLDGLRYKNTLINAENQAKNLQIGIWTPSNETCALNKCIILKELNYSSEFFTIKNNCTFFCRLDGWFVKDAGRNTFKIGDLMPGEEKTYPSGKNKSIWNDNGDRFFMFDKSGLLVIFYQYP